MVAQRLDDDERTKLDLVRQSGETMNDLRIFNNEEFGLMR